VELRALHTPGHTPEHVSFLVTDGESATEGESDGETPMGLLSGDFVFVGDTGRPDLLETAAGQQGAMDEGARALFGSVQRFLDMEDHLQVWPGHGAGSACGKALGGVPETTVGYERRVSPAMQAAQQGEQAFTDYVTSGQSAPPSYFARMKRLNRDGPPVLGALPEPERLSAGALADRGAEATVIDARPDRTDFMRGHLPGALYAPFGKNFPTLAASYADPHQSVVLIIAEEDVEAATRSLVRVGLDRVEGYAPPRALASRDAALASLPVIDMEEMDARRRGDGAQVLDVRSPGEYERGHVPGATLAPHTRLAEHLGALPTDRTLLVHCGGGRRASSAASLLAARGFDAVHVDDRFSNWSEAHPEAVETGTPPAEEAT
jgi:hydroxyacylglutathione hydrolase